MGDIIISKSPGFICLIVFVLLFVIGVIVWKCRGLAKKPDESTEQQQEQGTATTLQTSSEFPEYSAPSAYPVAQFPYVEGQLPTHSKSDPDHKSTPKTSPGQRKPPPMVPSYFQMERF